jgi:hypothetical protein
MKTELTNTTLVDCLVVAKGLPQSEIDQIEAFSGRPFSVEEIAMTLMGAGALRWTVIETATREPLVVGGFVQVGPARWQTFFLANQRAWDEHGSEVTKHAAEMLKKVFEDQEYARIETFCLAGRQLACDWYEKIGLSYESTMKGYGANGESAVLYTLVKGAKD